MSPVRPPRIVTPHISHPGGKGSFWLLILGLIALFVWTWQVFDYGREWAGYEGERRAAERAALQQQVSDLNAEGDKLKLQLATCTRSGQIDRDAVRRAQVELRELQTRQVAMQQEIDLLRGVLSRGEGPLQVRELRLQPLPEKGHFHYSFTIAQVLRDMGKTTGTVRFTVTGKAAGKAKVLKMKELTNGERDVHRLNFTHYQDISGELQLPAGFKPETLTVDIRPAGKKLRRETRVFQWRKLLHP